MMYVAPDTIRLGQGVMPFEDRPDAAMWAGDEVFRLEWLFHTLNGSWEIDPGAPYGMTALARSAFLRPPGDPELIDGGGGDHNLFVGVLGQDGRRIAGKRIAFFKGLDFLSASIPEMQARVVERDTGSNGFCDIPLFENYDPAIAIGPWCAMVGGPSDVVYGVGMPLNHHVSTFAVFRAYPRDAAPPPVDPGGVVVGDLADLAAAVRELNATMREAFRLD